MKLLSELFQHPINSAHAMSALQNPPEIKNPCVIRPVKRITYVSNCICFKVKLFSQDQK
jgi:hypothetical protein